MNGASPSSGQFVDLSELAALSAKRDLLKEQMARAQALGQPSGRRYATWGGALAGGLGDILSGIAGKTKEARLAEQLAANQSAEQGVLGKFTTALGEASRDPDQLDTLSMRAIASGHPALSAMGAAALQHGERRLQRALQEEERKKAAERARIDDERAQKMLELSLEKFKYEKDYPTQQVVTGPGNVIYSVNPRNVAGGASPVPTAGGGGPLRKPEDLSDPEKKGMEDLAETVRNAAHLRETFKDEYAGVKGKASTLVGEKLGDLGLGDLAPDDAKAATAWWSQYDQFLKMPERLRISGQSLTASEERAFDRASRARRGGDPKLIREAMEDMRDIAARKLQGRVSSALARGVSSDVVNPYIERPEPPPLDTSIQVREPGAPVPTPNAARADPQAREALRWALDPSNANKPEAAAILNALGM